MGFNSVYRVLQEIFPQVDVRILKAVAIEHPKHADVAVEVILFEVLPYLTQQSMFPASSQSISPISPQQSQSSHGTPDEGAILSNDTIRQSVSPISFQYTSPISPRQSQGFHGTLAEGVEHEDEGMLSKPLDLIEEANVDPSKEGSISSVNANDTGGARTACHSYSPCLVEEALNSCSFSNLCDANDGQGQVGQNSEREGLTSRGKDQEINPNVGPDGTYNVPSFTLIQDVANAIHDQVFGNTENEELILFDNCQEIGVKVVPNHASHVSLTASRHEDGDANGSSNDPCAEWEDFDWPGSNDLNAVVIGKNCQEESNFDSTPLEVGNSVAELALSSIQEHTPDALNCGLQSEIDSGGSVADREKPETSGSSDTSFNRDNFVSEMVDIGDESTLSNIVTRSGQICRVDLLEDIIEDAKNNKKTLFSAVESVINLMREVELQQTAAEQAKEEAKRGGLDILAQVENFEKMLQHAKEANDMHAGEVYGEKSILATEARELQSRLLALSDERDKSLAILEEMHQTLEARLAAAEEEKKAAEQEKLEKEGSAKRALVQQEAIMEAVVEESKRLQQEAEENAKLREFLMDRGHVVDMLQGEISVICQDVRLLKEKFDEHLPLSKSVSSSQTSCILASSSSSLKSVASVQVLEQGESCETPKKTSPTLSIDGQSPKRSPEDERATDDRNALLEDGWDFFEE